MIENSELQNAKYMFVQVAKAVSGFIHSGSAAEFLQNLENWKDAV